MTVYDVIMLVLTILFGGLSLYLKTRKDLIDVAKERIVDAEMKYKDTTHANGEKFNWVVDTLYSYVPAPLKVIFTKELIIKSKSSLYNSDLSLSQINL